MPPSVEAFLMETSPVVGLRRSPVRRPPPTFPHPTTSSCRDCPPSNDWMICHAVREFADGTSDYSSSSSSDDNSEQGNVLEGKKTRRSGVFAGIQQRFFPSSTVGLATTTTSNTIKERLLRASNFASMLCVLDCTILPVITIVLPLFGIVAASPAQMEWLHELGHQLALWFVLPVGGVATTLNYTNHKKMWIAAIGWLGLMAVVGANLGCHGVALPGNVIGHAIHDILHALHHGILHRITNLVGCGLLLTSNYLSRKQGGCKEPTCTHKH